jgi:hypothetical protein
MLTAMCSNGMRNDAVSETAFDAAVMIHSDPAAGNETPATAVDETMNKLAEHAGALAVSASNVGFLHLPGGQYSFSLFSIIKVFAKYCLQNFVTKSTKTSSRAVLR